jgi:hypothetical protein
MGEEDTIVLTAEDMNEILEADKEEEKQEEKEKEDEND